MSCNVRRVHLAASILILALATSAAAAPTIDRYRLQQRMAYASFSYPDSSGCLMTSVFVTSSRGRSGPSRTSRPPARYDWCQGFQWLFAADGSRELQPDEFQCGVNRGSAALKAVFDVFDSMTSTWHTTTIDLTWTATSPAKHALSRFSEFGPGFRYTSREQAIQRTGEAVGSLLYDSTELLPWPSTYAHINSVRDGELSIYRG